MEPGDPVALVGEHGFLVYRNTVHAFAVRPEQANTVVTLAVLAFQGELQQRVECVFHLDEICEQGRGPRCAGPGRRRSQLPRIQPDAFDAPDFVGVGSKPARQDGQRGRRNGGAVSLGTLPAGTTEAQVDDMMMVLEVAGEATPAPKPA